ncbi:uncharacterized protein N7503_001951 [Penicillium pulvis]|uniref:uncharacterized protein n=1 Tax=Penicillium pulvis TaxID=1562058 RepID=UPI002547129C|nr:uncharacterized protein N7503_001951 [Penicillium pulvis]KAJ5809733.1 hypothetical protein N7503_001951 [Penicillium pulvis]
MAFFRRTKMLLLLSNIGIVLGVGVFMAGYFSPPPKLEFDNILEHARLEKARVEKYYPQPSPPFDNIIFMVIDALRSDFVYGEDSGFSFTQSLIKSGSAIPFTALAAPPTLTLSRIKAMTQGSGQSFLDAWLNVMHSADARRLVGEDTWLSRLKSERAPEKKMVYHGIDMWCMLYPEIWDRYETVNSFYLPNFREVDSNVTRGLTSELDRDDYKGLILHYLGLDNAAHFGGAKSSIVRAKQVEMDNVVRQIYFALERLPIHENTLFVLTGDHGMTENGNHGGDTAAEIASALVFISPKFRSLEKALPVPPPYISKYTYYSVVDQVDIVPTLAGLLGFSIPAGSVGIYIDELLAIFPKGDQQMSILIRNAQQMISLLSLKYNLKTPVDLVLCDSVCLCGPDRVRRVLCLWEKFNSRDPVPARSRDPDMHDDMLLIKEICAEAQQILGVPHNNLDLSHMTTGIALLSVVVMLLLSKVFSDQHKPDDSGGLIAGVFALLHGTTMFSSRLVAEEHHFWYWMSLAWLVHLAFQRSASGKFKMSGLFIAVLQIAGQSLNPAGETPWGTGKILHDILDNNPAWLWALAAGAHVVAARKLSESISVALGIDKFASTLSACFVCALTVLFKMSSTHNSNPELLEFLPPWLQSTFTNDVGYLALWTLWSGLLALWIFLLAQRVNNHSKPAILAAMVEVANVYLRTQARPKTLILFLIFDLQMHWLVPNFSTDHANPSKISLTVLLLAQSAFFSGGRNNSFASLDMMNGYNGISNAESTLNITLVTLQTILSNWIGPVWWSLAGLRLLSATTDSKIRVSSFLSYATYQTLFSVISALAIMASCIWWRDDAMLWTVLAPKYVNVALWVVFHQTLVNGVLCSGLWFGVAM